MLVHEARETAVGRQHVECLRQFLVEVRDWLTRRLVGESDPQLACERPGLPDNKFGSDLLGHAWKGKGAPQGRPCCE